MTKAPEKESVVRPVDLSRLLEGLKLKAKQAAELVGVPPRQLAYWEEKGYIRGEGGYRKRSLGYPAIEKACLIKQALDRGYSLERAVELAGAYLDRQARERAKLEAMPIEELQASIMARTYRLQELARRIRHGLRGYRVVGDVERKGASTADLGGILIFLESRPYQVFTAFQIGVQLGLPAELVQEQLQVLEQNRFIQTIHYPRRDVYRYIPPRR